MSKAETFWNEVLAEGTVGTGGGARWTEAKKQLAKLSPSLNADMVKRICELVLKDCPYHLWGALSDVAGNHAEVLVGCLRPRDEVQARALVAAYEAQGLAGLHEASAFLKAIEKSTNWPGLIKRLPEIPAGRALVTAAAKVVSSQSTEPGDRLAFWALTFVAARSRPAILDELAPRYEKWDHASVLERMRAALSGKKSKK